MNHVMFNQIAALDHLDHVAVPVEDLDRAVSWYRDHFRCEQLYKDHSWALLRFANTRISLVQADEHPPHLGFVHSRAEEFGPLIEHRDGTRSVYVEDSEGNAVELLDEASMPSEQEH